MAHWGLNKPLSYWIFWKSLLDFIITAIANITIVIFLIIVIFAPASAWKLDGSRGICEWYLSIDIQFGLACACKKT